MRLIPQLVNGILRFLQKLLTYSNGTTISTFFLLFILGVFPDILILNSNDLEITI